MSFNKWHVEVSDNGTEKDWYTWKSFDELERATNLARSQSEKHPEEVYRIRKSEYGNDYEYYFKAGKVISQRRYTYLKDSRDRGWLGDDVPELPVREPTTVEYIYNYSDADNEWHNARLDLRSPVIVQYLYGRKCLDNERLRRVTYPDGKVQYWYWGAEISEQQALDIIKARVDRMEAKKAYILPEGSRYVGSAKFDDYTFKTPAIENVIAELGMLVKVFDNVNFVTTHPDFNYITNQLHVMMENIHDKMDDRNDGGSPS